MQQRKNGLSLFLSLMNLFNVPVSIDDSGAIKAPRRVPTGRRRPGWHSDERVQRATIKREMRRQKRQRDYDSCIINNHARG